MDGTRHTQHRTIKRGLTVGAAIFMTTLLAGCSNGGATSGEDNAAEAGENAGAATCGEVPQLPVEDPDGLLEEFDEEIAAYYNGSPNPVLESAWADWTPDHEGPYTAALVTNTRDNPFWTDLADGAKETLEEAGVEIVADLAAPDAVDVATQAQQFQQALSQNPDIILLGALAPDPAIEMVEDAAAEGVPVISMHLATNSDKAISLSFNGVLDAMQTGAGVAEALGGEGSVLHVHGVPGVPSDIDATTGFEAVLDSCPDLTLAGEVDGMYGTADAQQAVVEYLATNPAGVDAAFQSGVMGLGVLQGFDQAGQSLTAIADIGMSKGSLATAQADSDLQFFGTAQPAYSMGETMSDVALRVLAGQGPKINQFVIALPTVTGDNYDAVWDDSFEVTDQSGLAGDPDAYFPEEHLDQLFNNPELTIQ